LYEEQKQKKTQKKEYLSMVNNAFENTNGNDSLFLVLTNKNCSIIRQNKKQITLIHQTKIKLKVIN